jgi:hypothetical protein
MAKIIRLWNAEIGNAEWLDADLVHHIDTFRRQFADHYGLPLEAIVRRDFDVPEGLDAYKLLRFLTRSSEGRGRPDA